MAVRKQLRTNGRWKLRGKETSERQSVAFCSSFVSGTAQIYFPSIYEQLVYITDGP